MMFMKRIAIINLIVFICFLSLTSYQANQSDDKIYWTNSIKLTWDDFKGAPDQNSKFSAITKCGYGYEFSTKKDSISIVTTCYFKKKSSWVKENTKTKALLKHEQCHFDLAELNARKFRKLVASYQFKAKTAGETIESLFNKSYSEYSKIQEVYDKETNISRSVVKQSEWEKKIAKELKELSSYSGTTIKLYLSK